MLMLDTINWRTPERRRALERTQEWPKNQKQREKYVDNLVKDISKAIFRHGIKEMKEELKQRPTYEFLMEYLPTFDNRPWLQSMSRGSRIPVSRLLLS